MTEPIPVATNAIDLPVAVCLNQRLVFDLLAVLEDGFSRVQRIQTAAGSNSGSEAAGSIGIANPFALIGIGLKGSARKVSGDTQAQTIEEEVVHTPTSLYTRLVRHLQSLGLLGEVSSAVDARLDAGQFIRIRATLQRSPLVETLRGFKEMVSTFQALSKPQAPRNVTQKPKPPASSDPSPAQFGKTIDALLDAVSAEDSIDLVGSLAGDSGSTCLLTAEKAFFVDPTLNDLVDGEFWVVGKVTRVLRDDSESTSLFRKQALGRFTPDLLGQLASSLSSISQPGFTVADMTVDVKGPCVQVVPIAIHV